MQPMRAKKKTPYEEFAKFFDSPTREEFRELLKSNFGEFPHLDFKEQWPALSKVARHILGMGNLGGGAIIAGVAELADKTLEPKGLDMLLDKSEIVAGIKRFLPEPLMSTLVILDFSYDASEYAKLVGKRFQVILVEDDPQHLPFVAKGSGDGIRETAIYIRRGTSTEEASHEELQRIINRRLDTGHSSQVELDLQTDIEQLKVLYKHIDKYHVFATGGLALTAVHAFMQSTELTSFLGRGERVKNELYPKEDFESFVARMIEKKKRRIEMELGVTGFSYELDQR